MNRAQTKIKKAQFLDELRNTRGLIYTSCLNAGISKSTYYNWLKNDKAFSEDVEMVLEVEGDKVESAFKKSIDEGEVQAQIFYLKTKLKNRGYTERDTIEDSKPNGVSSQSNLALVEDKFEYYKSMMVEQKLYSPKFDPMIRLTAQTSVKYDKVFESTLQPDYQAVITQKSREGNERQIINSTETLLHQLGEQLQSQIRALGLNADSKPIKGEEGGVNDFLDYLNND